MTEHARLGPIELAPGVSPANGLTYIYACFAGITLTTFVGFILPYILDVNLGVPAGEQGRVVGDMGFYRELVLIASSSLIGALSDRKGRRLMLVAGLFILGTGFALFGYVGTVQQLILVQVFLAVGTSLVNVMIIAIQVDYAAESSRGKLVALSGVAIGLGAMLIGVFFARLPSIFADNGATALIAGRYTLFVMATLGLATAVISLIGIKGGKPAQSDASAPLKTLLLIGYATGRDNPRILLAYLAAFVSRGDLVVIGTFYSLWLKQAGEAAGMPVDEAFKTAGGFFALVMGVALLWAPILGVINDRLDRTAVMALALGLATIGYLCMGLIPDPLGGWMYPGAVLLGIGQMSVVSACQTLVGQEAPPAARGAVTGMFALFGAGGILFITKVGGQIYDAVGPASPFVLIGAINGLLLAYALWIMRKP